MPKAASEPIVENTALSRAQAGGADPPAPEPDPIPQPPRPLSRLAVLRDAAEQASATCTEAMREHTRATERLKVSVAAYDQARREFSEAIRASGGSVVDLTAEPPTLYLANEGDYVERRVVILGREDENRA